MRVWAAIQQARAKDRALEERTGIRRRDPQADKVDGRVYTPADIRALEKERKWKGR